MNPHDPNDNHTDKAQAKTTYFADSDGVDPTPGWIPFVFVIGIAAVFTFSTIGAAIFVG